MAERYFWIAFLPSAQELSNIWHFTGRVSSVNQLSLTGKFCSTILEAPDFSVTKSSLEDFLFLVLLEREFVIFQHITYSPAVMICDEPKSNKTFLAATHMYYGFFLMPIHYRTQELIKILIHYSKIDWCSQLEVTRKYLLFSLFEAILFIHVRACCSLWDTV